MASTFALCRWSSFDEGPAPRVLWALPLTNSKVKRHFLGAMFPLVGRCLEWGSKERRWWQSHVTKAGMQVGLWGRGAGTGEHHGEVSKDSAGT